MFILIIIGIVLLIVISNSSNNSNTLKNKTTDSNVNNLKREKKECNIEKVLEKSDLYINLTFKKNWMDYFRVMKLNNVEKLYHFTDRENLESIKKNGGLYSWDFCEKNNLSISKPGGDELSRSLDKRYGLENYVRLSFSRNHPMMHVAKSQNRINNPIILEIDPEVIFWKNSKYSDKNATRNDVIVGEELDNFKGIKFNIAKQATHFDLAPEDKQYYQAEVLVLEKIPLEFIKNI
mgnify:CR=1 FL=1